MSKPYVPPPDYSSVQHNGTEHMAVKNTFLRRLLVRVALKTTARFYERDGPCVPISRNLIVKKSRFVHLTEAATMAFIAEKTSIPVPRVHTAFVNKNKAYIVMERIRGEAIPEAWKRLTEADLENITSQLRRMVQEMRALKPPAGTGVESCVGGSLHDSRMSRSRPRFGPFKTIQDFHHWLREGDMPEEKPEHLDEQSWIELKEIAAKQDGPWPPPVFTHGDLTPWNIMVRGDQVVSIIDWEFAGWYPRYWEYSFAVWGVQSRQWWQRVVDMFLEVDPDDLSMELTRQRLYSVF